nr:hypothetical protein GCM10020093_061000 [Planobispora longispora]
MGVKGGWLKHALVVSAMGAGTITVGGASAGAFGYDDPVPACLAQVSPVSEGEPARCGPGCR